MIQLAELEVRINTLADFHWSDVISMAHHHLATTQGTPAFVGKIPRFENMNRKRITTLINKFLCAANAPTLQRVVMTYGAKGVCFVSPAYSVVNEPVCSTVKGRVVVRR